MKKEGVQIQKGDTLIYKGNLVVTVEEICLVTSGPDSRVLDLLVYAKSENGAVYAGTINSFTTNKKGVYKKFDLQSKFAEIRG